MEKQSFMEKKKKSEGRMVALVTHDVELKLVEQCRIWLRVPEPWCKLLLLPVTVCGINIS